MNNGDGGGDAPVYFRCLKNSKLLKHCTRKHAAGLSAYFHKQISDDQFEIEWYDYELKRSFPTPTIIVSEIRKQEAA